MKLLNYRLIAFLFISFLTIQGISTNGKSIYQQKIDDPEATYFIVEELGLGKNDDVSDALQKVIDETKIEKNFGVIFIPEGSYRISKTIYIPKAIRLIGYGKKRPEFVLTKNSPGYQEDTSRERDKKNYMFWFVGDVVREGSYPVDANAGTFYSAISNINLRIEDGNPHAVGMRTNFAQHSFVSHMDINIGKGKAGIQEVGNEMASVRFFGGDYGIMTTKTSPSWPMMMVDVYFEGQRKGAIRTREAGLTAVRMNVKNVPTVVEVEENYFEKLFFENCIFENVKEQIAIISNENNSVNQITFRNIICKNVPTIAYYRRSGTTTEGQSGLYKIKDFRHGLHIDYLDADPEMRTVCDIEPIQAITPFKGDLPELPAVSSWVSVKDLGAKGDGETDDTEVFLKAIEEHQNIFVPDGWYVISEPLVLKENTNLIGLNPIASQLMLKESTPAFSGFGKAQAILTTPQGGVNIVSGIGLNTGAYNYRAVGCKWMAGEDSFMNDVKFVGGHGNMSRGTADTWRPRPRQISSPTNPVSAQGKDLAWDNQHWSLWITNGGGGTFKDIWTATSYSNSGLYVSDTDTPGRIYAMSLEHHVRNEARFKNVSNWKVYAFQFEEESREGEDCQPLEIENCSNMMFANLYTYQVIRVTSVFPYAIRTWNCKDIEFLNLHNYAQTKYSIANMVYDINTAIEVRPWEINRLYIKGDEKREEPLTNAVGKVEKLATGFTHAVGMSSDSKGNIYFCEQLLRRVYKWSPESETISLVADFPWQPVATGCDTEDNLLVLFRYDPQPGYMVDGKEESVPALPDAAGTSFSGWGNSGFGMWVYSMDPENPEETITLLPKRPMGSVSNIHKALYPSNRWRDSHDFNTAIIYQPKECFVALDGVTIIPCQYDLARTCALLEAYPGKPFYTSDEYDKRMVQVDVDSYGNLSNVQYFVENGEFGSTVDQNGDLYVADGQVHVFNKSADKINMIKVPERPLTMVIGKDDHKTLYINSYNSLFKVRIK